MSEIVSALQIFLEFIVLGIAAVTIVDYMTPGTFRNDLKEYIQKPLNPDSWLAIVGGTALVFLLGVIVNSASYAAFESHHKKIIHTVRQDVAALQMDKLPREFGTLRHCTKAECTRSYYENVERQTLWQTTNGATYHATLSRLDQEITLLRGASVLLSLGAILAFFSVFALTIWKDHFEQRNKRLEEAGKKPDSIVWWKYLLLSGISLIVVYIVLLPSYESLEYKFHRSIWAPDVKSLNSGDWERYNPIRSSPED